MAYNLKSGYPVLRNYHGESESNTGPMTTIEHKPLPTWAIQSFSETLLNITFSTVIVN